MKLKILLLLCLFTFSCSLTEKNLPTKRITELKSSTQFGTFFCSNLQQQPDWRSQWISVSQQGTILIDSAIVVRSSTYHWCYLLPVVSRDSLVGIVVAPIAVTETEENNNYLIRLERDTQVSDLEFLTSSNSNFHTEGCNFPNFKRMAYPSRKLTTKSFDNVFYYEYTCPGYSYIDGTSIVVVGGFPQGLEQSIAYFKNIGSPPIEKFQVIPNFLWIEFSSGRQGWIPANIPFEAYLFAGTLNEYLKMNGYRVTIRPMFNEEGTFKRPGSDGDSESTGGGGGSGSIGDVTTPPKSEDTRREDGMKVAFPKASKIVNLNSKLTSDEWKALETILKEMIGIDKIIEKISQLGGNSTVELTIDPNAESQLKGWKMTLSRIIYGDVAEEFFHVYQRAMNGPPTISNGLSREFEAKIYTYFSGRFSGNAQFLTIPIGECSGIFNLWESENNKKLDRREPISPMSTEDYTRMMQAYKENTGPPYCEMGYDPNYGFGLAMDLFK